MANVTQLYGLLNKAAQIALGAQAIQVNDTAGFVSLGNLTLSSDENTEAVFKTLTDLVGRTVFAARALPKKDRSVKRDEFAWGAYYRKVHYLEIEAGNNSDWDIDHPENPYEEKTQTQIVQKIFGDFGTYAYKNVLYRKQLQTAFRNEGEMEAFLSGIYVHMDNELKQAEMNLENLAVNTLIAGLYLKGKATQVRYIRDEFNTKFNKSLTMANCLDDLEFQKFFATEMGLAVSYMDDRTELFNAEGIPKFTPRDKCVVEMLAVAAKTANAYLQADTYHKELVALPNYHEVNYWQGPGTSGYALNDISKIHVANVNLAVDGNATGECEENGIIAVIHDVDAVASFFGNRRSYNQYDGWNDRLLVKETADKGYAVDLAENAVVFTIADKPSPVNP